MRQAWGGGCRLGGVGGCRLGGGGGAGWGGRTFMILMNFSSSRSLSWAFSCNMMIDRTLQEPKGKMAELTGLPSDP